MVVAGGFETAREVWRKAGRDGSPRLVALAYYALGDAAAGRENVRDYYGNFGDSVANGLAQGVCGSADALRRAVKAFGTSARTS